VNNMENLNKPARKMIIVILFIQLVISTAFFIVAAVVSDAAYGKTMTGDALIVFVALITLLLISIVLFVLGIWKASVYVCKDCGEVVHPRFWNWFFGMHFLKSRRLFCPKCNKQCWCKHIWWVDENVK